MKRGSLLVVLCLAALASGSAARPALIWVEIPGARARTVEGLGRSGSLPWLGKAIAQDRLRRLTPEEAGQLGRLRGELRSGTSAVVDAGWRGRPASGRMILGLAGRLREASDWLDAQGRPSGELLAGWSGEFDWVLLQRIAGLDETLRWEEVEEFVGLAPRQNRALRGMPVAPQHPLWRLRRAFSADKLFANAALYVGRTTGAARIFLVQEIAACYEEELLPWTDRILLETPPGSAADRQAASRRFFLRRLRSSSPRIYGRLDRVLQSLQAEWGDDGLLVVDASRSGDPFLAVGPFATGPLDELAIEDFRRLLTRAGWARSSSR